MAADVPFVFDQNSSGVAGYTTDQIEQAHISSPDLAGVPTVTQVADNDVLDFPITGGDNTPIGTTEKKVSNLKIEFNTRVEPDNSRVNEEAVVLALKYPGDLTIDQIASIYSYMKNGDDTKKGWGYVRDPRGIDFLRYANASLELGDRANCVGGGDCDDFAILMAALVESVGGTTRIILANNNSTGGHAYTEVYLGQLGAQNSQVEDIISWLKQSYDTDKIYAHIDTATKDVWLNLDWGPDESGNAHPGGPFYQGDKHIVLCIRDGYGKTTLKSTKPTRNATIQPESSNAMINRTAFEPSQEGVQSQQSRSEQQTFTNSGKEVQKWVRTFGGSKSDEAKSVQQTRDSGYIITGETGSYGTSAFDAWLIKTDSNGNMMWNKTFGESSWDCGNSVQQTSDGGYIITGYASSETGIWMIKTDSAGNKIWDKAFGGEGLLYGSGNSILQTSDGGYIIAAQSYDSSSTARLIKTDADGNKLWDKVFDGSYGDTLDSVQQTSDGGYIIVGKTTGSAWLIKTDANGNKLWDRILNESNEGWANSVQQTNDGGYVIAGVIKNFHGDDAWLIKTDADGNKLWDKIFNGSIDEWAYSVQQTNDGGYIIITGERSDFGDACLIKTDSAGNKIWERIFGGPNEDILKSVQQTNDGGYVIAGTTKSFGAGNGDVWLIKTDANGNV